MSIALLLCLAAVAGPALVGVDPNRQDLLGRLAPPVGFGGTAAHPLGTDALGRDVLARLVTGARVSLLVGLAATAGAGAIGITFGALAGWVGGPVDRAVAWLSDVQAALPFVVVAIAAVAALGNGLVPVLVTLVLTGWVGYARVVRSRPGRSGRRRGSSRPSPSAPGRPAWCSAMSCPTCLAPPPSWRPSRSPR
jgi:peptide/nickel transport system permease protein